MKALTVDDLLNLPPAYGITPEVVEYVDFYGPEMKQAYMQAYVNFYYNSYYVPQVFNHVVYGLVGLLILLAMGMRLLNNYAERHALPRPLVACRTLFAQHFALASVRGGQSSEPHAVYGQKWAAVQIPTRMHASIVFLYVLFNVLVAFCWYDVITPNCWYQDIGYNFDALLRGFSDRTGIISIASTPLVIVLAGRNSPIATLTGASYSTLQLYHRWVSRVAVGHAISHSIGYSLMEGLAGKQFYISMFKDAYWNWGIAATCGGALLAFGSFRRLREVAYETFLLLHIFAAVAWIVGCYYHVWLLDPEYSFLKYIYSAVALWGFDRAARWTRLVWLNFTLSGTSRGGIKRAPLAAEGYVTTCGNFVRLRVTLARGWPQRLGGPGAYVFISSPTLHIWENHPFTITWPTGMPDTTSMLPALDGTSTPSDVDEKDGSSFFLSGKGSRNLHRWNEQSAAENATSFELVLKKHAGFTKRLAGALDATDVPGDMPSSGRQIKILVEGPYGETVDLSSKSSILLVAGGSGIAAPIAHLAHLAQACLDGNLKTERIVLVWAIRDLATLHILLPYLHRLRSLLPANILSLRIHHTCTKESLVNDSVLSLFKPVLSLVHVEVRAGRPHLPEHLATLHHASADGSIAVSACGPVGLIDAAREAVRGQMGRDGRTAENLVFHDELFCW